MIQVMIGLVITWWLLYILLELSWRWGRSVRAEIKQWWRNKRGRR